MNIKDLDSSKCVNCRNCENVCRQKAISFVNEKLGFAFPKIDSNKCVNCGCCVLSCQIDKKVEFNHPKEVYSFVSDKPNSLNYSSSGGAFYEISSYFIKNKGVVYGCAMINCHVKHIRVDSLTDLKLLQGSKYVQSDFEKTSVEVEDDLKDRKKVLFSGTPCQVFALKLYLKKEYDNLFTIDIVCHGVPSQEIFTKYVQNLELKFKRKISEIQFRNKNSLKIYNKCRFNETIKFDDGSSFVRPYYKSSFYSLFLNKCLFMDACYQCKFARKERIGDITLGDFWGIRRKNKVNDQDYGCSLVMVNTTKGEYLASMIKDGLIKEDINIAIKNNEQLNCPSKPSGDRLKLIDIYHDDYSNIDFYYKKHFKKQRFFGYLKSITPRFIKNIINK